MYYPFFFSYKKKDKKKDNTSYIIELSYLLHKLLWIYRSQLTTNQIYWGRCNNMLEKYDDIFH